MRNRMQSFLLMVIGFMYPAMTSDAAIITVSSTTFQPNDATVSVSVMLSNPDSTSINIAALSFQLEVTPVSPRRVEFDAASQPDSLTNSNYIFFGNSAAFSTPYSPWGVNSTGSGINNNFVFSDTTDNTLNVSVPANASKLLANIRLKTGSLAAKPQIGDVFTLNFISAGTSIFDASLNTVSFTTGSGVLTVAVPEPSTYAMMITCSVFIGLIARKRRQGRFHFS